MNVEGKNVSIIGLVRSGVAVAQLLDDRGARVLVSDCKGADELRESLAELRDRDIQYVLGGHDERCIEHAELVVVSPGVPLDIPILQKARSRGIPVLGELEIAYRFCQTPMIAVTGTKGKSTTASLIGEILRNRPKCALDKIPNSFRLSSEAYRNQYRIPNTGNVCVAGNIGVALSREISALEPEDLVVAEVSSFQLESTKDFHPIVSVILNITPDHLDRHKTMEHYIAAKKRIFANQTRADYIILNADNDIVSRCASETAAQSVFFSNKKILDKGLYVEYNHIVAREVTHHSSLKLCHLSDIPLLGAHNIENVLAAAAVGIIFGVPFNAIHDAIIHFRGMEHALEVVAELNGITFINDSKATNIDAVRAALESLEDNIILIMGGYDKGNDYRPLRSLARTKVKALILLGSHTHRIRAALVSEIGVETPACYNASTMCEAVQIAYSHATRAQPHATADSYEQPLRPFALLTEKKLRPFASLTVLLSPANASFDMFQDYKARGDAFRKAVQQLATRIR